MFVVLRGERGIVGHAFGVVAIFEGRTRAEDPDGVASRAPRERDGAFGELGRPLSLPGMGQRAPLGAERVGGQRVDAGGDVIGVNSDDRLGIRVERSGRPERKPRRDPTSLELGAGGAVEDEGARGSQPIREFLSGERHLPILARPMPHPPAPLAVFCDFDGTFSVQDVGATLAQRHAPERRPTQWARYERGEITPWEYNLEILHDLPVDEEMLDAFLRTVELDPGAEALLAWCKARGVPFRILSDGFDWNLDRLQEIHGVCFDYTANHLHLENGRWRIRAGAPDPSCGCGTGVCKASQLRACRAALPSAHLVHIGNGRVSDTCGALAADTAFAKDSLAESLEKRGEAFVQFETLYDVIPHLEKVLAGAADGR